LYNIVPFATGNGQTATDDYGVIIIIIIIIIIDIFQVA